MCVHANSAMEKDDVCQQFCLEAKFSSGYKLLYQRARSHFMLNSNMKYDPCAQIF